MRGSTAAGLLLKIHLAERLTVIVADDEAGVGFFDDRGAARSGGEARVLGMALHASGNGRPRRLIFQFGRIVESSLSDTRVGSKYSPSRKPHSMSRLRFLLQQTRSSAQWE